MSKFKVGDHIVLIAGPDKSDEVRVVTKSDDRTYPLRVDLCTYTEDGQLFAYGGGTCMRHATDDEIATQQKPKPIRRGDLVKYDGDICVVFGEGASHGGKYWIASLTGEPHYYWVRIDEFVRIGSIRKKIKQLQAQKES